ncbi:MAG: hypothetical protein JO246_16415 [Frankiaceae bacterium]|nr:hypothetical protein [Frankiaceae bacterium]MBV9869725.1 hypothetical protein [Frankiaceae bacterium]
MTEPLLPDTTSDEREVGWGDDLDAIDESRSEDERYAEDRPPHHDQD